MTNEQRKKTLCFLIGHKDGHELVEQNQLRYDDDNWYIREDKLPVSRKDGSCSTINQRLIDPLIFNWLMDKLPDYSELADSNEYFTDKNFGEKNQLLARAFVKAVTKSTNTFKELSDEFKEIVDKSEQSLKGHTPAYGDWNND